MIGNLSNYFANLGQVTGPNGSPLWKWGLDVDLKIGDPVPSPVSGEVIYVGKNGGFGNQVKVRDANGNEIWLSHLQGAKVKVGDKVGAGQVVGSGGNSGNTIPGKGGDGSHLDITIKKPKGGYFTAPEVQSYINQNYSKQASSPVPALAKTGVSSLLKALFSGTAPEQALKEESTETIKAKLKSKL